MSLPNKFSNIKNWWKSTAAGTAMTLPEAEQAYLAAAADHQDLERRMQVLDCRHGSVLHTLRVLKVSSY
jgi:cyclopropane fatty-acyl-phospholipid synthase-like methyltransferase